MLNSLLKLATELIKPLMALGIFLTGFFRGKSSVKLEVTEKALENAKKADVIEEKNLAKSDADVLGELLNRDSRRES